MDIQRLGLIDYLFRAIEHTEEGDSNHSIAMFFLKNYNRIGKLNIYDVADECYVSRSSVRRFCKQIGYHNFQDFKRGFRAFDFRYNYFMQMHEKENYREWYAGEVASTIKEVDEMISQNDLEKIAQRIYESKKVLFFSSYSSAQCVMEFQRPLVLLNKIIHVMTDTKFSAKEILACTENDSVFMVSTMGNFARNNLKIMENCTAYKGLITTSHDPDFKKCFTDIYYLTKKDYSNIKSVQGKYGTVYLFDILYNVYLKKYGNRNL